MQVVSHDVHTAGLSHVRVHFLEHENRRSTRGAAACDASLELVAVPSR